MYYVALVASTQQQMLVLGKLNLSFSLVCDPAGKLGLQPNASDSN